MQKYVRFECDGRHGNQEVSRIPLRMGKATEFFFFWYYRNRRYNEEKTLANSTYVFYLFWNNIRLQPEKKCTHNQ